MLLVLGIVLAACGGGSSTPGGQGPDGQPAPTDVPADATATSDAGQGATGGGKASGAKVRIFNAYTDPVGTLDALDVYALPYASEGDKPLLSVGYGELSPVFDPTVADDAGNMFLSGYVAGETGNGNEVMSVTETLKGTEVITYFVARGNGEMGNGRAGAITLPAFDPTAAGSVGATPGAGKGRVEIDAVGLDNVWTTEPDWFAGFGDGCALSPGDTEHPGAATAPGTSGATYDLDPGTYPLSLYLDTASGEFPTCTGKADFVGPQVTVEAGKKVVVLLYASTPDELKAVAVPLSVP
ncbi:MAG: hypothetical protein ABIR11_08380 [Candidatus Limnocylindrales bacterium]